MSNSNNFNAKMQILGTSYKKSSAYKIYGDLKQESNEASSFWKTNIGYIEKYKHAKFQAEGSK